MKLIVGHTNMDLDCLGSLVLARRLFPGYRAAASARVHPVARNLYNFFKYQLDLPPFDELSGEKVEELVIVDTRSRDRVMEYLEAMEEAPSSIHVWDHHHADSSDIPGAVLHSREVGANSTLLGLEVMARGMTLTPEEATIALAGIFADTGNFTHENVTPEDFAVAGFLAGQGASLALVKTFLHPLSGESQITLFHSLVNRLTYQSLNGHFIITSYMELEKQTGGLAAVVEKVFEVENPDAMFSLFHFRRENDTLIIARSGKGAIDLTRVMETFGGGGHAQAYSALVKNAPGRLTFHALLAYLRVATAPAVTAQSIMTTNVVTVLDSWTCMDASLFLEGVDRTGAPVVDQDGRLKGFLSLRDIMKARRAGRMASPVRSFMTRDVIAGERQTTLREIEAMFFTHTIYYIPIVEEGRVVGLVTRSDYLKARGGGSSALPLD